MSRLVILFLIFVLVGGGIVFFAEPWENLDRSNPKAKLAQVSNVQVEVPKEEPEPLVSELAPELPPDDAQNDDLAPENVTQEMAAVFGSLSFSGEGGLGSLSVDGGGSNEGAAQLIREAQNINRPARAVRTTELEFPIEAKTRQIKGTVVVALQIEASGRLGQIRIKRAEPPGFFEEAVRQAVGNWKFEPGLVSGVATTMWIEQKIRFELDE